MFTGRRLASDSNKLIDWLIDWLKGRRFHFQPLHYHVTTLGNCSRTCSFITEQYNLVLAKGWCCCAARKVAMSLVERNGAYHSVYIHITCRLTAISSGLNSRILSVELPSSSFCMGLDSNLTIQHFVNQALTYLLDYFYWKSLSPARKCRAFCDGNVFQLVCSFVRWSVFFLIQLGVPFLS